MKKFIVSALGRIAYMALGAVIGLALFFQYYDINTYCWKLEEVEKASLVGWGIEGDYEQLELWFQVPNGCGGTVSQTISTPFTKEMICAE